MFKFLPNGMSQTDAPPLDQMKILEVPVENIKWLLFGDQSMLLIWSN